ncbi:hypothetical protein [Anaerovirgula multivorans]|uniref:hypothetical protein n=1 Tax=Anaerovirgula multivorans TaxID=312168 RepID=UPI001595E81D|nr:hypothetical protein [Anaerovirgula multivorans]
MLIDAISLREIMQIRRRKRYSNVMKKGGYNLINILMQRFIKMLLNIKGGYKNEK